MTLSVTAIVPRVPPLMDGIGDYALALARGLRSEFDIETRFVVTDPSWTGNEVDGFSVSGLPEQTSQELIRLLTRQGTGTVLLHYEGYAYAKRGCPTWLVEAMENWRQNSTETVLLTIFHELYASGPPWSSSFWLSPQQRNLAARLSRITAANLTSLEVYAQRLNQMGSCAESLPVFSSIGEPRETPPTLPSRRRRMVVFGTGGRRKQVYRRSGENLMRLCRELGITEIWDIGRESDGEPAPAMEIPVVQCGEMSGDAVSEILLDSVAGVIDYPEEMLGKSTIFAAYCAHRLLPVVGGYGTPNGTDGLQKGTHYSLLDGVTDFGPRSPQEIADCAFEWYQPHQLAVHTQRLAVLLSATGARKSFVYA